MKPKEKISTKQLAEILDCTPRMLSNYRSKGIIKEKSGDYHVSDITAVVKHLRAVASSQNPTESQQEIKLRREKIRCEREERKNAVESGKLIDAAEEHKRDFQTARIIRDALLNVPERMRPHLEHETYVKLKKEITEALSSLAGEP